MNALTIGDRRGLQQWGCVGGGQQCVGGWARECQEEGGCHAWMGAQGSKFHTEASPGRHEKYHCLLLPPQPVACRLPSCITRFRAEDCTYRDCLSRHWGTPRGRLAAALLAWGSLPPRPDAASAACRTWEPSCACSAPCLEPGQGWAVEAKVLLGCA